MCYVFNCFTYSGVLGVFCSMGVTGGVVVGQIISLPQIFGNTDYWHICLSFQLFIVVLCTIPYAYFPESPKFILTVQKDRSKAIRELLKLCDSQEMAEYEFELMKDDTDVQNQSLKSVLTNPKLMLPLVLCAVMQGGQQLSGINAVSILNCKQISATKNNTSGKWVNETQLQRIDWSFDVWVSVEIVNYFSIFSAYFLKLISTCSSS